MANRTDIPTIPPITTTTPRTTTPYDCPMQRYIDIDTVTISTPNYPRNYPNNANCQWYIRAPDGKGLKMVMTAFNLEYG